MTLCLIDLDIFSQFIDFSFPIDSGKEIFKDGIETAWVRNGIFKM